MSKVDGRQARAIQGLAAALQECLDSAAESGARRVREEIRSEVRSEIRDEFGPRFDRQDETLRLMWHQCGGDPARRLPVDD